MNRSLKNQSDLFLELTDIVNSLVFNPEFAGPDRYDIKQFVRCIVMEEGIQLLLDCPDLERKYFVPAIKALSRSLQDVNLLQTIFRLNHDETERFCICFDDEKDVCFNLKSLDFYLFEAYGETANMRHARIDDFLTDFVQCYPIRTAVAGGDYEYIQDVIYQVLKDVSTDHYFLTNRDLAILIEWLIKAYNEGHKLFHPSNTSNFFVSLEKRSVKVKCFNHYTRER